MARKQEAIGHWVDITTLEPWKDNPRQNLSAISEVAESIRRFGFASPIIARSADNMIIAGHTRFAAAKSLGMEKVPVRFMDLDMGDAQLLALADNKIGEIADWDESKLADILEDLKGEQSYLEQIGFDFDILEVEDPAEEMITGKVEFSEFINEENNYIVLLFDNEMDWLAAQTHFQLDTKMSRRQNGKEWSKGLGRVINGAHYLTKMTDNQLKGSTDD